MNLSDAGGSVSQPTGASQPGEPTERLQAIQQRLDKATRGPWRYCGCGKCGLVWQPIADFIVAHADAADDHEPGPSLTVRAHNAELIGHAPGDLSYLLGEVASLRQQNAELTLQMERLQRIIMDDASASQYPTVASYQLALLNNLRASLVPGEKEVPR